MGKYTVIESMSVIPESKMLGDHTLNQAEYQVRKHIDTKTYL